MENVCRICLCSPNQLQPLFDGTQLSEKIRIISSVVIEENDGFPNSVCADCIINVNSFYNFRLVVINSDEELRRRATESIKVIKTDEETLLTSEIIIKEEESDFDQIEDGDEREATEEMVIETEDEESDDSEIKKYKCKKCDFVTEDLKRYRKHNRLGNHKSRRIKGEESDFDPIEDVDESEATEDEESDDSEIKKYQCKKCNFVTEDLKRYRKHNRLGNHNKPRTGVCNVCGKTMGIYALTRHVKSHEMTPTECNVCGKVCKNSESLRYHQDLHKFLRICEYCGKSFNQRANYYYHVTKHHKGGPKKLNCSFCEKVFFYKPLLKKHIQKHTGERPHICEFCQKGFSSTDALKTHKLQHTNENPYKCKLCSAAFKQRVLLRNHLKTKHPGQEYDF